MPPKLAVVALFAVALTGCGHDEAATPQTTTTYRVLAAPPPIHADLGPLVPGSGSCFTAVENYAVALVVEAGAPAGVCTQLDGYLPRDAGRAGWPVPETGDEEQDTPTLECAVGRDDLRVEALSWNRGPSRVDPYDICRRMVVDGWELRPQVELGGADAPYGSCFVATARYEVAITGTTDRGQPLCDELGRKYLPAVATRSVPAAYPDRLGDPVCEATRREERVLVVRMPGDRGAVDLRAICDSLDSDGWNVAMFSR